MKTNFKNPLILGTFFLLAAFLGTWQQASAQIIYAPVAQKTNIEDIAQNCFDHFQANAYTSDTVNSYLLSVLAEGVNTDTTSAYTFRQQIENDFNRLGLEVDQVTLDTSTGTTSVVLSNEDSVFVVFGKTSCYGSIPEFDEFLSSGPRVLKTVTVDKSNMAVCRDCWENVGKGIWDIYFAVIPQYFQGKNIWICGHGMGGANATILALRLHYDFNINVQGVETFGSPTTGTGSLIAKCDEPNNNYIKLSDRTRRWVMRNDPVPSRFPVAIPESSLSYSYYLVFPLEHVGSTNGIYGQISLYYPNEFSTFYFQMNCASDPTCDKSLEKGLQCEHLQYQKALERKLRQEGFGDVIDQDHLNSPTYYLYYLYY